jgi:hypothetical protein
MRFIRHIWLVRPTLVEVVVTAIVWGMVVPLCIFADYYLWRHMLPPAVLRIAFMFALGAFVAAPVALWCTKIFARKKQTANFAAMFLLLSIGTIGITAVIFAFDFWLYFVHWHGATFSKLWANQFIFTFASAIYQFLVSGLRLYLPFGFLALVFASLWASRRIMR